MAAGLAREGVVAGLRLEGPFLSAARCGAPERRHVIAPDVAAFERLHAAAAGSAARHHPRTRDKKALIKAAVPVGVIAAIGHSDATADITSAAVDAAAGHATHLFNGMRPLHHREPGPVGALPETCMRSPCEVIADGVHLHDTAIRLAARAEDRGGFG